MLVLDPSRFYRDERKTLSSLGDFADDDLQSKLNPFGNASRHTSPARPALYTASPRAITQPALLRAFRFYRYCALV
jgi:hypothetical protein